MNTPQKPQSSRFELAISYLLMSGVIISLALAGAGILLYSSHFGQAAISESKAVFLREQNFFYFLLDLLKGAGNVDQGLWLITLGIAMLILTPYARVILSVIYFLTVWDWKFTLISLFVLVLLTVSLIIH